MPLRLPFSAICLLIAVLAGPVSSQEQSSAQDLPPLAKLVEVTAQSGDVTRQFFGRVVAKETVDLAFQVGGQVQQLPVLEGNTVPQGDLIAQLDLEPFQLALEQATANKDQADRTLERLKKLEGNTVSQVSVDDAVTNADLQAIAVRDAERSLRLATLRAPFDGLVATRDVANFSTVAAGTPVVRLHNMSEIRIEIEVPEVLFQQAGEDPDVDLTATFPTSDTRYPLTPREFNAETSSAGQTFRITLGMEPVEGLAVLPGSTATVSATLKGTGGQIEVPRAAVLNAADGQPQVMVFTPTGEDAGQVARTDITITPSPNGTIIVTEGLEPGQEIVASGAALLQDGQDVRRFTGFAE